MQMKDMKILKRLKKRLYNSRKKKKKNYCCIASFV